MGVASHLGIRLQEYDSRIRTFIPDYDEMLDAAAAALSACGRPAPRVLDLGTGSGALARRVLRARPGARIVGVDEDEDMLAMAHARLGPALVSIAGDFVSTPFPRVDAVTAAFALHHVASRRRKAALYRKVRAALGPAGVIVSADCFLASDARLRAADRAAWLAHLTRSYTATRAKALLRAWGHEDTYLPLDEEVALLRSAGFRVDITWRRNGFGVLVGTKRRSSEPS